MHKIIIDLGFGDSGKGLVTDWLCSQSPNSLVVRFNGGHQAGHTVVRNGIRHVFSNFGSGTLVGTPTYWSKYCTVEPIGLLRELGVLQGKNVNPTLYIDAESPITTPYDTWYNQNSSTTQHGSCGVGFGATLQREERFYSLKFIDLFYPAILNAKLASIAKYYGEEEYHRQRMFEFMAACASIVNKPGIHLSFDIDEARNAETTLIFEGAQGLLLDQHFGFFPNVTRSNTGCQNAINLLQELYSIVKVPSPELFLVTRAYQTRHGNGFMSNTQFPHNIVDNPDETNKQHEYQGAFKRTLLDLALVQYAMQRDKFIRNRPGSQKKLVITCLDHVQNEHRFTDYQGALSYHQSKEEFVDGIIQELNFLGDVYTSEGDSADRIQKWD